MKQRCAGVPARDRLGYDLRDITPDCENGSLFFALPEDEDRALDIAELLLASGADPRVTDKNGITAIEHAEKEGYGAFLFDVTS